VATLTVLLLLALVFGLSVGLGVGWIAIVPLAALFAVAAWSALVFTTGRSRGRVVWGRPRRTKLLGPGGPDDPDATV
jgi:hypothetical protein